MIFSIHQPHYMPWLGYFNKIINSDVFVILDNVQFVKREFQNRNKIKMKDGVKWLTVPVKTKGRYRQIIKDVEIDWEKSWNLAHLSTIGQAYRRAKYFNEFYPMLEKRLSIKYNKLCELNLAMLELYMEYLGIDKEVVLESTLGVTGSSTDRIVEISNVLGISTYYSGVGGKNYMDMKKLRDSGIEVVFQKFIHPSYRQLWGDFVPYMSVIDLIFNEGKNSRAIIESGGGF